MCWVLSLNRFQNPTKYSPTTCIFESNWWIQLEHVDEKVILHHHESWQFFILLEENKNGFVGPSTLKKTVVSFYIYVATLALTARRCFAAGASERYVYVLYNFVTYSLRKVILIICYSDIITDFDVTCASIPGFVLHLHFIISWISTIL